MGFPLLNLQPLIILSLPQLPKALEESMPPADNSEPVNRKSNLDSCTD